MDDSINKISYLIICSDDKKYWGTPDEIVCEMRSWDTMCGRVKTNNEYMKLVAERSDGLIKSTDEYEFLRSLENVGNLTMTESN